MEQGPLDAGSFGHRLRRLRVAAGLTQEGVAERSGVSVDGISALENGRRRRPRADTLLLLANALGLGPDQREGLTALARAQSRPQRPQEAAPSPAPRAGEAP